MGKVYHFSECPAQAGSENFWILEDGEGFGVHAGVFNHR